LIVASDNMPSNRLHTPLYPCITWTQNMPRYDKVKINRPMGTLEEKIAAVLLYWLHSFPLTCLILSTLPHQKKIVPRRKEWPHNFHEVGPSINSQEDKTYHH
jgi:hypothetical protein